MSVLSFIEWNSCVCLVFQEAMAKMAKVGKVVQPDSEVQRWGILQQERKRLTLMPSFCLISDMVMGYFRNEIWNIQQASNLSHDFLYFFLFFSASMRGSTRCSCDCSPTRGSARPSWARDDSAGGRCLRWSSLSVTQQWWQIKNETS